MRATTPGPAPYYRLSGLYFFYFASIGAFVPFWSLYLADLGFAPAAIGELMAILVATKIIAPNLWGWMADHTGQRMRIIRIATFLAFLIFMGVIFVSGYWPLAILMAAFSFFWHATLPQLEATTMGHLREDAHRYAHIRLWGSIGFIVSVSLMSPVFDVIGIQWLPVIVLLLLGGIWLNALFVPGEGEVVAQDDGVSIWRVLRTPAVISLFAACFFMQASHGPYYTFFSIYLEDHGYARSVVGSLWALGVVAEVLVFTQMHRLLPRFGASRLLLFAIVVTTLRWVLIALFVDVVPVLLVAQLMHAASYGLYHAAAISLIHRLFPGRLQGRGQALYSSLSFGVGGALGSLASGYVWEGQGGAATYLLAATLAGLGILAAIATRVLVPRLLAAQGRSLRDV
ncbi:MAG: MFS transporter [Gammaproteobacteria bacterium]|nr:MFS transporter [Gammaproteobacteria bacterium]MDX5374689.1 MFS transporter [Gammaproteobacteria bacterium]